MAGAGPFDTVRGLPVHALVVHATVVAVPLVLVAVVVVSVAPSLRRRFLAYAAGASALLLPLVGVTILSGRQLRDRLPANPAIQRHESLGMTVLWWTLAVAVVAVVAALLQRLRRGGHGLDRVVTALALVTALLAGVGLVQVFRAGEAGSSAVWKDIVTSTN